MGLDVGAATGRAPAGREARPRCRGVRLGHPPHRPRRHDDRGAARCSTCAGWPPRRYDIVSFGGCGALFTPDIAATLGMRRVLVPELSSVLSAFGAATADIRRERARSISAMVLPGDVLGGRRRPTNSATRCWPISPRRRGTADEPRSLRSRSAIRPAGLGVDDPLGREHRGRGGLSVLLERFRAEYVRRYGAGSMMLGAPVELLTIRAVGVGATVRPAVASGRPRAVRGHGGDPPWRRGERRVRIGRGGGSVRVPVFDGDDLRPGHVVTGPALVDERDTTVWLPAGGTWSWSAGHAGHRVDASRRRAGDGRRAAAARRAGASRRPHRPRAAALPAPAGRQRRRRRRHRAHRHQPGRHRVEGLLGDPARRHRQPGRRWRASSPTTGWRRRGPSAPPSSDTGNRSRPGDVFLANDPYNGGGLHPNDVFVQRPIFLDGRLVAWAALSAHLIDMGGMAMGSFAPAATDCFQEALRIPPVRVLRRGHRGE